APERPVGVAGRAVDLEVGRAAAQAELGGDDHLVATPGDGPADELLVVPRPVGVGGVEERDAQVEGPPDDGDGDVLVRRRAIAGSEAHASEADRRDLQPAAQPSPLHPILPARRRRTLRAKLGPETAPPGEARSAAAGSELDGAGEVEPAPETDRDAGDEAVAAAVAVHRGTGRRRRRVAPLRPAH